MNVINLQEYREKKFLKEKKKLIQECDTEIEKALMYGEQPFPYGEQNDKDSTTR